MRKKYILISFVSIVVFIVINLCVGFYFYYFYCLYPIKPLEIQYEERKVVAADNIRLPYYLGYISGSDGKARLKVITDREVCVWQKFESLLITYKKGGEKFKKPQLFIYRLPYACHIEAIGFQSIYLKDVEELEILIARAEEEGKMKIRNGGQAGK